MEPKNKRQGTSDARAAKKAAKATKALNGADDEVTPPSESASIQARKKNYFAISSLII
jgi:hypothetical protein